MEIPVYDQFDAASDKAFDFNQALATGPKTFGLVTGSTSGSALPTLSRVRFRF